MNPAVNVTSSAVTSQASSTVLKSPVNVTPSDGVIKALDSGLRPTVIVSPVITVPDDTVNVIPKADDVQALNTATHPTEIDELVLSLLNVELKDFKRQIDSQCNIIMLAAVEKYRLEKLLEDKEKEIENYKPFIPEPIHSKPVESELKIKPEVITIEDDMSPPIMKCGYFICDDPVVEGSDYCKDPNHDYDGFAQRMPDFSDLDFTLPGDDTILPTLDLSSICLPTSQESSSILASQNSGITLSSSADDVFTTSTPIDDDTQSTPEDQYIIPSQVPPAIRKRGYVYKCFHRGCHKPERIEGGFFCSDHMPENQLGHPVLYNEHYGITTPIKRNKLFIPLMKTKRKKCVKPTLRKYKTILPKM